MKHQILALCDKYHINCTEPIGEINGKETKTIKVITLINTKNRITIYPVSQKIFNYPQLTEDKIIIKQLNT